MKSMVISFLFFFIFNFASSQNSLSNNPNDKTCYIEWVDGEKITSEFEIYYERNRYSFKFESGFSIGIVNDIFFHEFIEIIEKYEAKKIESVRELIGSYRTSFNLKNQNLNPRKQHIQSLGQQIYLYKSTLNFVDAKGQYLEIYIPSTKYFASSNKSPEHSVYIPEHCISQFIKAFSSN